MRHCLFVLLLIPLSGGFAQTRQAVPPAVIQTFAYSIPTQFDHFSLKDGLSNQSVNCILQDREGFMWFGTDDGLNKYDGYTFTTLKSTLNDPTNGFLNNQILGLCEDHTNRLWVATLGGLHEVDKQTGHVTPHPIRASKADQWNYQHSVYEDSQHVLWVSTLGGLARYEPTRHHFTLFPVPRPEATIKTVFEDPQHRFWVATYQGLYLFDRSTGRFTLIPMVKGRVQPAFISFHLDHQQVLWLATATAGYSLFRLNLRRQPWHPEAYNPKGQINPFTFLNSLHSDREGIFWLATTTGLQRIDPVHHQVFTYRPDPNTPKGISSNTAQSVYHDRAGTLWVGTDNGIDRQIVRNKPFMTYQIRSNAGTANLPENKVVALLTDQTGRFWISNGYKVYRQATDNRSQLIPPDVLGSVGTRKNYTQTLLPDGADGVWLGTSVGLYHYDQTTGRYTAYPSEVPAEYMSIGPTGDIWIGGFIPPSSGIACFNPRTRRYCYYKYSPNDPNGLPDQYVNGLLVSRSGDVWILFRKQGVGRLNPRSGRFFHYTAGPRSGLNSNDMLTIHEDKAGTIWVGTYQGGMNRFDARTGLFSAITTHHGLASDRVVGITSDNAGHIWLSTDKGICRFDPITRSVRNYRVTNGLPSDNFLQNAVFRQKDRLFFGSLNGIVYFNPDSIRDDTRPFPVYITELKVRNQLWPLSGRSITLKHDENFLSFSFAALTYAQAAQNQYAYQLTGVDKEWVQNGNRHFASYTNLPPGDYTFRVKAANSDGLWNEQGASIRLVVQPPWWASWWAYGGYALLVGGAVVGGIGLYTNRLRQRQEMELNRREASQLKAIDELKTRFFANITHEFRTPLSLIISPVEKLLQDNRLDAATRHTLTMMRRNADQLLRLINQLLDLSRLEANRMAISLTRGEVTGFVGQLVDSFRQAADQKGIRLIYTPEPLPHEQLFDSDKWEKILTNLLSNALKFTGEGGQVTVCLAPVASPEAADFSHVQLEVADSGIGIPPDNIPHIFDRFYQVDNSRTRAYEGTGIGLALTKELVELLGGTITVASQPNVGTTFRLTLPIRPAHAPSFPAVSPTPVPSAMHAFRDALSAHPYPQPAIHQSVEGHPAPQLLIVEDNDELREFLAGELATGYQVLRAADGEEGWQLVQSEQPDVVISDIMMPRLDGYALTHLIKNHPATDHIPVILLTARAAHHSLLEGLREGADDYMAKPFHLDELHLRLRNLITHRQKLRAQHRRQLAQPDTPLSLEMVQDAFLRRVYALLETNLSDPSLNVDWLADQLAMSRKTLYRKIDSLVQLSPNELIRQYRLRKAADLLRAGHTPSQTAYQVGFKAPSYFTLVFKEFYQQTPTEFVAAGMSQE